MDHSHFKSTEAAAIYVANALDQGTLAAFEIHLMRCTECLADVEAWRAIRRHMPARHSLAVARARTPVHYGHWRVALAASLVGAVVVGFPTGWAVKSSAINELDSTVVLSLQAVTRGSEECQNVQIAADTRTAILRVTGLSRGERITAFNSDKEPLSANLYDSRIQPDGSHLLRLSYQLLAQREIYLRKESTDGSTEPLACVAGQVVTGNSHG